MWNAGHWMRIIVFIVLGVFLLGFAEPYFNLEPWQRYGFGALLIAYAGWRIWWVIRHRKRT